MKEANKKNSAPQAPKTDYDFSRLNDIPSCPPAGAKSKEGKFYAFHGSDPPDESDFQTAAERSRPPNQNADECRLRSNSIWSDLAALQQKIRGFNRRHALRFRFISVGNIKQDSGVFAEGDGPHHSFWVCGKTSMHAIFTQRVS